MNRIFNILFTIIIGLMIFSCITFDSPETPSEAKEKADLMEYLDLLAAKGYNIDTTALGTYYIMLDKGTGMFPKLGDTLTVVFIGYFIDGSMFVSSAWNSPADSSYTFVYGKPERIKGWDDSMRLLNTNAKAQIIIPSNLAFGSAGQGNIPPYRTLVYVIKMKSIKPAK